MYLLVELSLHTHTQLNREDGNIEMLISPCDPCHWSEIRDQMTVAIETRQKLGSAPPHPKKKLGTLLLGLNVL